MDNLQNSQAPRNTVKMMLATNANSTTVAPRRLVNFFTKVERFEILMSISFLSVFAGASWQAYANSIFTPIRKLENRS